LAAWLKRCGIETVALESTGIYWISLYEVLEQYGFEIRVVNARHVKNVPGRSKSDVLDCQWIRKLHSFSVKWFFSSRGSGSQTAHCRRRFLK
jgi:transposase